MDAFLQTQGQARSVAASHKFGQAKSQTGRGPPTKRLKREVADSDGDSDEHLFEYDLATSEHGATHKGVNTAFDSDDRAASDQEIQWGRPTAIESALPDMKPDQETLEHYETFKASQGESSEDAKSRFVKRDWVKGQSSLYADAFNLALSTVLDDESHLFDEREKVLFEHWAKLSYEAQFLYVRLFLRKTAWWHRIGRLGYHGEISDTGAAVRELQEARWIGKSGDHASQPDTEGVGTEFAREDFDLGDSFAFADRSEEAIDTVEEAISLLNLDELKLLAKEVKVGGKNKADYVKAICNTSHQQAGLLSMGLRRSNTHDDWTLPTEDGTPERESSGPVADREASRQKYFMDKISAITGPCIRLSLPVFKLFERVLLVFYRSSEWTEKSLTTIILAKISRRHFPNYIVSRSSNIFASRAHLVEFETATRTEFEIDSILESRGYVGEDGYRKVLDIFDGIYARWQKLLGEEQEKENREYDAAEGGYLRRFSPVHPYTRIVHKAAYVYGRLREHEREYALLTELLEQRLFQPARRGAWYQRKALLEEHYMFALKPNPAYTDAEMQKKHWKRLSLATCETALEDRDCHLKYHHDLQKRLVKLERQLRIPHRLQHDFGHVRLKKAEQHSAEGIQLKKDDIVAKKGRVAPSTKTIWLDEAECGGECSVEAMCLSWYRGQGWKGYHAEGGIIRTLFAYLFFDILFLYMPNVFQTAYQTCPLDLFTDSFYPTRASEINHRLVEIANGEGARLVEQVDGRERERRTCVVGLNWDYELADLVELVSCFDGAALAAVCKVMAQEYGQRGGGLPDLILWRTEPEKEVMFSEVKSANDRLSDTQRLWIHVLTGAGVRVALCNAVAKEVREV